jgi:phospholipid transport system substrate-binding protein
MRRGKAQTWRMQNLVVEGINIGLNYKSQFAAAMKDPQHQGDLDAVIDAWNKMIDSEDPESDEEATEQDASDSSDSAEETSV